MTDRFVPPIGNPLPDGRTFGALIAAAGRTVMQAQALLDDDLLRRFALLQAEPLPDHLPAALAEAVKPQVLSLRSAAVEMKLRSTGFREVAGQVGVQFGVVPLCAYWAARRRRDFATEGALTIHVERSPSQP